MGLESLSAVIRTIEEVASIAEESSSASEEASSAALKNKPHPHREMAAIAQGCFRNAEKVAQITASVVGEAKEMSQLAWNVADSAVKVCGCS